MTPSEIRELTGADLDRRLNEFQQELFNLRFQYATRQLTNHSRFRVVRRDIARINTIIHEREAAGTDSE